MAVLDGSGTRRRLGKQQQHYYRYGIASYRTQHTMAGKESTTNDALTVCFAPIACRGKQCVTRNANGLVSNRSEGNRVLRYRTNSTN
mmetsp:Transcript_26686/g.55930  ORF Transcript_26686/g.55930 Transcript_26686/m.55930 type:complete len:87 (+) Transcript_26686:306-566(+)